MNKHHSIATEKVRNQRLKCYNGCLREPLQGYFVETCSVHNPHWKTKEINHE